MHLKQSPEHSRHSINVSCIVKIENSSSTATTFISKKGLLPKELEMLLLTLLFERIFQIAYHYSKKVMGLFFCLGTSGLSNVSYGSVGLQ